MNLLSGRNLAFRLFIQSLFSIGHNYGVTRSDMMLRAQLYIFVIQQIDLFKTTPNFTQEVSGKRFKLKNNRDAIRGWPETQNIPKMPDGWWRFGDKHPHLSRFIECHVLLDCIFRLFSTCRFSL